MTLTLSRFWRTYLYIWLAALLVLFLGPSLGLIPSLTTKQLIMAVYVPLSFLVWGYSPSNYPREYSSAFHWAPSEECSSARKSASSRRSVRSSSA